MSKKTGKGLFGVKLGYSNKINKILKKYGDKKIRAVRVGRRPINSMVEKAFNIISLGKWDQYRKQYYYDTLFHLFIIMTLEDGTKISLEKNSIVNMDVDDSRCSQPDVACEELEYPANSLTVKELVMKPLERMGKESYFVYDPFKANCQIFVRGILETFGLYNKRVHDFVYQELGEIIEKLPFYVKYIAKKVTDADATVKNISGEGLPKKCGCHSCVLKGGCMSCERCPLKSKGGQDDQKAKDMEELTDFVLEMLDQP